ncbi:type II restriction enzyme [Niallia sp. MER 6]|uniref:type II restriction enzyme n=1 Tax=Niallia sp. MER 6 TaxID=2939567 RepID=UPI0020418E72|nr:translation elongation factor [Niallia sp. MER 6]MCM3033671.1 translation elongation factor [Niallia sp. MER 6]
MSLNDRAWETLFDRYEILNEVNEKGFYEISAKAIKEEREPRLMAKFDHSSNLPQPFKKNGLSILPISRSSYVIGEFDVYKKVTYNQKLKPIQVDFPSNLTTIEPTNLYSESATLHCASATGMIDYILGEDAVQTISGRMSSKHFDFNIKTRSGIERNVSIKNAQVEIDGGYESDSSFMIVEAKKESVDDFLVRQLYYPFRLWQEQTYKNVKPVFFTHSNDIFSFFIYEFTNPNNYNSLKLIEQKDFVISHEEIELEDILEVLDKTKTIKEPEIPFPQADSFPRIIDLLGLLMENDLTKEYITINYDFDERQTNYYTTAAMYLGLIDRVEQRNGAKRIVTFRLSNKGKVIMRYPLKQKYIALASCIIEHEAFKRVLIEYLQCGHPPEREKVVEIMLECELFNVGSESTYFRRASTVTRWVDWILDLPNIY